MNFTNINPKEDSIQLANGCRLYWTTSKIHGGRIYHTDEISPSDEGPVVIWDTALISGNTLLAALSVENALQHAGKPHNETNPSNNC